MARTQREPEFARPRVGVRAPQEADDALFGDETPAGSGFDPLAGWSPLPDPPALGRYGASPYGHAPVLLTLDGVVSVAARWRTTRRFSWPRWVLCGFWADRVTGQPIGFEPKMWRELRE